MFDMTPGERRGALVVLALCALGALWDLGHVRPVPAPPAADTAAADPGAGAPPPAAAAGESSGRPPARVDLNRADATALDALPGIGPVLAARIVEHRRAHGAYGSVDELLAVPGIGPRLLERLRPLVSAGGTPNAARTVVRNATAAPR
jgi:competence ComEA-like helix-hairpin-helix protein